MNYKPDIFRLMTGKSEKDYLPKFESPESVIENYASGFMSRYPLMTLGRSSTGDETISEELRGVNFHILGGSGEGKSKFLEHLIRHDIDSGNGLCLIDPSDFGATSKSVLKYCASKNIKKVLYITPDSLIKYDKIPIIQPLNPRYLNQSVAGLIEAISMLFGNDPKETPRIKKHLSALLRVLARNNGTLFETQYFGEFKNSNQSMFIANDFDSRQVKSDYKSEHVFNMFMSSTVNRLDSFWYEPLNLMLAAKDGIDFETLIRDKWIVIVNIAPSAYLSPEQSQLLGILFISQLSQAIDRLKSDAQSNEWKGVYYLYIDEAGRFSTPQIEQILDYKRKSGLRLVFAHHYFEQFDNRKVLNAVKQNTGVKVMFNTREPDDRLKMMKSLGYGGEVPPEVAAYANKDLPKQYAILKKNKEEPVRIRIPDVFDIDISDDQVKAYVLRLMDSPWYRTEEEINDQIKERINERPERSNSKHSQSAQPSDSPANNSIADGTGGESQKELRENKKSTPENGKPKGKPLGFKTL